ncbi:hypothetical protein B566_EDAN004678 [Ephemera danica]|nr:hypothetical protein B566_EDAN004678 [Ephemera danica]
MRDLRLINESLLAPWQKLDAVTTFLLPRMDFIMRGGNVKKTRLQQVDKLTKELVKRWMWLPKRASNEVVYLLPSEGGAGCLPLGDNCDLLSIVHGYRHLTCRDAATGEVAWNVLGAVVRRKIGRPANKTDICRYLSGDLAGEFGRDGGDIASLWSRVRNASRRLAPRIHLNWSWSTEENELHLHLINPLHPGDTRLFINPQTRMHCCRNLRDAVRGTYKQRLFRKPDQGKPCNLEITVRFNPSHVFSVLTVLSILAKDVV